MQYAHPTDILNKLYLPAGNPSDTLQVPFRYPSDTLLYRRNTKVPTHLQGQPVPCHSGYYFPDPDTYFYTHAYIRLLQLSSTDEYPIDITHTLLPTIWDTWYAKHGKGPNEGEFLIGTAHVFGVEANYGKRTPHEVTKAKKLAICKMYYEYRKAGTSSADAQDETARYFQCAPSAVRNAWAVMPVGMDDDLKALQPLNAPTVRSPAYTRAKATKRTPEYKIYSKAVARAAIRVHITYNTTGDPLFATRSFGVADLLVNGRLLTHCPVLGIPLDYSGANTRSYNAVSVWRKDTAKGFTPDNMTVMSRLASLLIEDTLDSQVRANKYLISTERGPAMWREWSAQYTTKWGTV